MFAEQERAAEAHNFQGHFAIAEGLSSGHDESQKVIISAESLERRPKNLRLVQSKGILPYRRRPSLIFFEAQPGHAIKILGVSRRPTRLRWSSETLQRLRPEC